MTFLDVGQGDAAIVELPGGEVWLVDAGGDAGGARPRRRDRDPAARSTRALAALRPRHVDLAIVSHPHPDHYLGLAALGVPIGELWSADDEPTRAGDAVRGRGSPSFAMRDRSPRAARASSTRRSASRAPRRRRARRAGRPLPASPTASDELAADPVRTRQRQLARRRDRRTPAGRSCSPATSRPKARTRSSRRACRTSTSSRSRITAARRRRSAAFVAATRPALAVISCGVANAFGFPSPDVVARWRARRRRGRAHRPATARSPSTVDADGDSHVERFAPVTVTRRADRGG